MYVGLETRWKATPETIKKILDNISKGLSEGDAAYMADIDQDTLTFWKKASPDFSDAIIKARSEFKGRNIQNIAKAGEAEWKASAWLLERKFREEFGQSVKHDVGGNVGIRLISYADVIEEEEKGDEEEVKSIHEARAEGIGDQHREDSTQLQSEGLPATVPEGDGFREEESGDGVAPSLREGRYSVESYD